MAELKTKQNNQGVEKFLNGIKDEQSREDCFEKTDTGIREVHVEKANLSSGCRFSKPHSANCA